MQEKSIFLLVFDTSELNEQDFIGFLNDEERSYCSKLALLEQKKKFIITRAKLRQKISELYSLSVEEINFSKTANGKPFCDNSVKFSFNVSHTDKYVVIAYCPDQVQLGVDAELKTRSTNFEKLAKRHCHPIEKQQLSEVDKKPEHFLKLWTLKESYIKMLGEKISTLPTNSFAFKLNSKILFHPPNQNQISFCLFNIDDLFISIAVTADKPKIIIKENNLNDNKLKHLLSS